MPYQKKSYGSITAEDFNNLNNDERMVVTKAVQSVYDPKKKNSIEAQMAGAKALDDLRNQQATAMQQPVASSLPKMENPNTVRWDLIRALQGKSQYKPNEVTPEQQSWAKDYSNYKLPTEVVNRLNAAGQNATEQMSPEEFGKYLGSNHPEMKDTYIKTLQNELANNGYDQEKALASTQQKLQPLMSSKRQEGWNANLNEQAAKYIMQADPSGGLLQTYDQLSDDKKQAVLDTFDETGKITFGGQEPDYAQVLKDAIEKQANAGKPFNFGQVQPEVSKEPTARQTHEAKLTDINDQITALEDERSSIVAENAQIDLGMTGMSEEEAQKKRSDNLLRKQEIENELDELNQKKREEDTAFAAEAESGKWYSELKDQIDVLTNELAELYAQKQAGFYDVQPQIDEKMAQLADLAVQMQKGAEERGNANVLAGIDALKNAAGLGGIGGAKGHNLATDKLLGTLQYTWDKTRGVRDAYLNFAYNLMPEFARPNMSVEEYNKTVSNSLQSMRDKLSKDYEDLNAKASNRKQAIVDDVINISKQFWTEEGWEQFGEDPAKIEQYVRFVLDNFVEATGEQIGQQWPMILTSVLTGGAGEGLKGIAKLKDIISSPAYWQTFMGDFCANLTERYDESKQKDGRPLTDLDVLFLAGGSLVNAYVEHGMGGDEAYRAGLTSVLGSVFGEIKEELVQDKVEALRDMLSDLAQHRDSNTYLYSNDKDTRALINLGADFETAWKTALTTLGMDALHASTFGAIQKLANHQEISAQEKQDLLDVTDKMLGQDPGDKFSDAANGAETETATDKPAPADDTVETLPDFTGENGETAAPTEEFDFSKAKYGDLLSKSPDEQLKDLAANAKFINKADQWDKIRQMVAQSGSEGPGFDKFSNEQLQDYLVRRVQRENSETPEGMPVQPQPAPGKETAKEVRNAEVEQEAQENAQEKSPLSEVSDLDLSAALSAADYGAEYTDPRLEGYSKEELREEYNRRKGVNENTLAKLDEGQLKNIMKNFPDGSKQYALAERALKRLQGEGETKAETQAEETTPAGTAETPEYENTKPQETKAAEKPAPRRTGVVSYGKDLAEMSKPELLALKKKSRQMPGLLTEMKRLALDKEIFDRNNGTVKQEKAQPEEEKTEQKNARGTTRDIENNKGTNNPRDINPQEPGVPEAAVPQEEAEEPASQEGETQQNKKEQPKATQKIEEPAEPAAPGETPAEPEEVVEPATQTNETKEKTDNGEPAKVVKANEEPEAPATTPVQEPETEIEPESQEGQAEEKPKDIGEPGKPVTPKAEPKTPGSTPVQTQENEITPESQAGVSEEEPTEPGESAKAVNREELPVPDNAPPVEGEDNGPETQEGEAKAEPTQPGTTPKAVNPNVEPEPATPESTPTEPNAVTEPASQEGETEDETADNGEQPNALDTENEEDVEEPTTETEEQNNEDTDTDTEQKQKQIDEETEDNAKKHGFKWTETTGDGSKDTGVHLVRTDGKLNDEQYTRLKAFDAIAKATGWSIEVRDDMPLNTNGKYTGQRTLYLNTQTLQDPNIILGHELVHGIQKWSPKSAEQIAKIFEKASEREGFNVERRIDDMVDAFNRAGVYQKMNDEQKRAQARKEIVANYAAVALSDINFAKQVCVQDRGVIQRVIEWAKQMQANIQDMLKRFQASSPEAKLLAQSERDMRKIQEICAQALREIQELDPVKEAAAGEHGNGMITSKYERNVKNATSKQEITDASRDLAKELVQLTGNKLTDNNIQHMINAATDVKAGTLPYYALRDNMLDPSHINEEVRSGMRMLGGYMENIVKTADHGEWNALMNGREQQKEQKQEQYSIDEKGENGYNTEDKERKEVREDDERTAERSRGRAKQNRVSGRGTIRGSAALRLVRGDYSGVVAKGSKGYELFRRALEGSEIKSRKGDPILWFHGSRYQFDKFEENIHKNTDGAVGHYLTSSPEIAYGYAGEVENKKNIYPAGIYSKHNIEFNANEFSQNYKIQNKALEIIKTANKYAARGVDEKFLKALDQTLRRGIRQNGISEEVAGKIIDAYINHGAIQSVTLKNCLWDVPGQTQPNNQIVVFSDDAIVPATAEIWEKMADENDRLNSRDQKGKAKTIDQAVQEVEQKVERNEARIDPEDGVEYSLREEEPPKETLIGYKAFYARDGKLYPPMVSNISDTKEKVSKATSGTMKSLETPVGVWLDADVGGILVDEEGNPIRSKETGRLRVKNDKSGGKDSGLAFRPGWHLGEWPDAKQFNKADPETGERGKRMPDDLVFAKCEVSADIDYQLDALSYGISEKGGFSRSQAGLPTVPKDGYYKYRTNVDPTTAPWLIAGSMRVIEILDDDDCAKICAEYGVTPDQRYSGKKINLADYGLKRGPVTESTAGLEKYKKNDASRANDELLQRALNDRNFINAYVQRDIDFDNPEQYEQLKKEFAMNGQDIEEYRKLYKERGYVTKQNEEEYSIDEKSVQAGQEEYDRQMEFTGGQTEALQRLTGDLWRALALRKQQQKAENYGLWKQHVAEMARELKAATNSAVFTDKQLEERLTQILEEHEKMPHATAEEAEHALNNTLNELQGLIQEALSDQLMDEHYKEVKDALRRGIYINPDQVKEMGGAAELRDFRNALKGFTRVYTSEKAANDAGAMRLDGHGWDEKQSLDADLFNPETHWLERAQALREFVDLYSDSTMRVDPVTRDFIQTQALETLAEYYSGSNDSDATKRTREALKKANSKIDSLTREQQAALKKQSELTEQIRNLKQQAREADTQAWKDRSAVQAERDKLQQELKESREEALELGRQLNEAGKEAERLTNELNAKDSRVEYLKSTLDLVKKQNAANQREAIKRNRENAKQRAQDVKNRHKIKDVGYQLRKMLENPTDTSHVPAQYVREMLEMVQAVQSADVSKRARGTARWNRAVQQMTEDTTNYTTATAFDDDTKKVMQEAMDLLNEKKINDLDSDELQFVANVLKQAVTQMKQAGKMINRKQNTDALLEAKSAVDTINAQKPTATGGIKKMAQDAVTEHLRPESEFNKLAGYQTDNAIHRSYEELNKGANEAKTAKMTMESYFTGLMEGENTKNYKKWTGPKSEIIDTGIKGSRYGTFKLNHDFLTRLYMDSLSQENMAGMKNGLTMPDYKLWMQGKYQEAWARSERMRLTEADWKNLMSQLTEYDKAWAKGWQEMLKYSTPKLNNVSMAMHGWRKFNVENYFPIRRDKNYLATDFEALTMDVRLANAGWTKARKNATSPMMLVPMSEVVRQYINGASQYIGLAAPLQNFSKMFNTTMPGYEDSMKSALKRVFGTKDYEYIERLITDLNTGGQKSDASALDNLRNQAAGSALGANATVIMKQPVSFIAAAAELGYGPLIKAMTSTRKFDAELVKKYTPAYWERTAENIQAMNANANAGTLNKTSSFLSKAIAASDNMTVRRLWIASEYAVEEEQPNLKRGSEEYNQAVADKFEKVVERTQPEYGTMQRTHISRSNNQLVKGLTMYKTQAMQNYNIVYDSVADYAAQAKRYKADPSAENKEELDRAKTKMARALSSQIISAAALAVMTALGKALLHKPEPYQDDKGEITAESLTYQLSKDAISSMAGMMVGGSELFDLITGIAEGKQPYDIEASQVSMVNDLYQAVYKLGSAATSIGNSNLSKEQKLEKAGKAVDTFAQSVGAIFGLPVKNIENIYNSAKKYADDIISGRGLEGLTAGDVTTAKAAKYMGEALQKGDTETYTRLYNRLLKQGKTQSQINSALKSWMKTNDPRIQQAADAIDSGDLDTYNRLINDMVKDGYGMAAVVTTIESVRKANDSSEELGGRSEELNNVQPMTYEQIMAAQENDEAAAYTYAQLNNLLDQNNITAAKKIQSQLFKSKGTTAVKSALTSYWKPKYREAYQSRNRAELNRITKLMKAMGYSDASLKKWKEADTTTTTSSKKTGWGSSSFGSSSKKKSSKSTGWGSSTFGKGWGS